MSTRGLVRHPANPILSARDIPYPSTLIFNAGVARWKGRYVMLFRNDYGNFMGGPQPGCGTNLGLAYSEDGVKWQAQPRPVWSMHTREIQRVYDPRLTVIDDRCYVCFACDTRHGIRGGVAVTEDFQHFETLSLSVPDNRNMVLFPEKIAGRYARLERPFPIYGRGKPEAFDMWYSDSPDLRFWGNHQLVLGSDHVPYCNNKIGPAAPPIKTARGWLATIHTVWKDADKPLQGWETAPWTKLYQAGLVLLDLHKPWKVIGMSPQPILVPEMPYELEGFRGSVIFPGGMILEEDGQVKIYYGGADTVECLATAHVNDLLAMIEPFSPEID